MGRYDDAAAIRDVIDRYATGVDRRDWEMVRSCFSEDCSADYGHAGKWDEREPLVAWLDQLHRDVGPTMHRMTNHHIDVDGDQASATSYLDAVLKVQHKGFDLLHVLTIYTDRLRREDGEWRIWSRGAENYMWRREQTTS
ncbi:MAG: nuclear transport factor 2 family protein [Actinomycetota bacterium]|nr:nuclear transport factor 2 family protein [Actinomycetota bacterium]